MFVTHVEQVNEIYGQLNEVRCQAAHLLFCEGCFAVWASLPKIIHMFHLLINHIISSSSSL